MSRSIVDAIECLVDDLDADTREAAEASARVFTRRVLGRPMRLVEALELWVAAKVLAVGDDFDRGEAQGLRLWLTKYDMPRTVQRYLIELDVTGFSIDELGSRLRPGSVEARRLLWLLVALASFEGLRPGSRVRAQTRGKRLGVPPSLVRVLVEEAQICVSAVLHGDEALTRRLRTLRHAIFELTPGDR